MRLIRSLIYSNLFVAFVLCALTASSYTIVSYLRFKWYVVASVFLGSLVLYSFHRLYKIDFIPEALHNERHRWMITHQNVVKAYMAIGVFLLMIILPNFNTDTIVWLVPAAIASIGYTVPFLPVESGWYRLRDIPLSKPFIIALVVTYLTLAYPVFEQEGIHMVFEPAIVKLLFERFMFILAVTIPFEMRDIHGDQEAGLETLATEFGFRSAKRLALICTIIWFGLFAWRLINYDMHLLTYVMPLILLLLIAWALLVLEPDSSGLYYTLTFEGLIIAYSFALPVLLMLQQVASNQPLRFPIRF